VLSRFKVVIRCADFNRSRDFYTRVLGLTVQEEWEEPEGRGCILQLGSQESDGAIEIYGMTTADPRFDPAFTQPLSSDKIDLQIETPTVDEWAERLRGVWGFNGPETLPWGQRWIQLRDPDGLLIALYEKAAP
jgi:glyoxylase I family protein